MFYVHLLVIYVVHVKRTEHKNYRLTLFISLYVFVAVSALRPDASNQQNCGAVSVPQIGSLQR
jgi:hypothetical protein